MAQVMVETMSPTILGVSTLNILLGGAMVGQTRLMQWQTDGRGRGGRPAHLLHTAVTNFY